MMRAMLRTKLAAARMRRKWTQKQAAERVGVSVRTWEGWEIAGKRRRVPNALACAAILKVFTSLSFKDLTTDPYKEVLP
jgi:transcriptional regulator with XRE-family HTH domain